MIGIPLDRDATATTSLSGNLDDNVMDAGTAGDHDSDKHHMRNKAKGFLGKAAGQFGHQLSKNLMRRKNKNKEGPSSSEEVTTSGEVTPMEESGRSEPAVKNLRPKTEVPLSEPGVAKQPPSAIKQSETSHTSPLIPSEPPNRPPPGLPQPTYAADGQQSSTEGREVFAN